jgi:hypothetical protein
MPSKKTQRRDLISALLLVSFILLAAALGVDVIRERIQKGVDAVRAGGVVVCHGENPYQNAAIARMKKTVEKDWQDWYMGTRHD